jgi:hypothetical protein
VAQGPATSANQVPIRPADAIGGLLNARATAIRDDDRGAWLAGLDPRPVDAKARRFRAQQQQVFDRVTGLRPTLWSYQVTGGSALPRVRRTSRGGGAWLADVQLNYQLIAGGPQVRRQEFLTMVQRDGGWRIEGDTDGATARDVWDLGPLSHASGRRCFVVGARSRVRQINELAAECTRPARTVDAAWGNSWARRTVLTVPENLQQLAVLLGRGGTGGPGTAHGTGATAGLDRTAAVTIGPDDAAADDVLINGAAFDELTATGRRVVLTHELVHVATRATGSRYAPTWLEEGYADYVAYRGTGLSAQQVAGDALDAVRAGKLPDQLPSTDDFNAAGSQAASAYGLSWVAVGLIANHFDAGAARVRGIRAFYQQVAAKPGAGDAAVDATLTRIGLHGTAGFIPIWRARLARLAGTR